MLGEPVFPKIIEVLVEEVDGPVFVMPGEPVCLVVDEVFAVKVDGPVDVVPDEAVSSVIDEVLVVIVEEAVIELVFIVVLNPDVVDVNPIEVVVLEEQVIIIGISKSSSFF